MSNGRFVHLHIHSEYSLSDGIVRIPRLVEKARALGQPAVAITDQSNMFCTVKFFRAAVAAGVKPIIGSEIWLQNDSAKDAKSRLIMLCKNIEGYRQLSRLVTRSYREGQIRGVPIVNREWIEPNNVDQLICLSGGVDGDVGVSIAAGKLDDAKESAAYWQELFGDRFYMELVRTARAGELEYGNACIEIAGELGVPVVASNDVRFVDKHDFDAHEARVCINSGRMLGDPRRERNYSEEQYLKSADEMTALFEDLPSAIENSINIAMRCNLVLELGTYHMPAFPVGPDSSVDQTLREETAAGLQARWETLSALGQTGGREFAEYQQRAERELDVVIQMGFFRLFPHRCRFYPVGESA